MAIGYLVIQTRIADDAVPLENVRITVLDDQGRRVYDLMTDESGKTPMVSLETVEAKLSLDPNYAKDPYVSYGVLAQAAGFQTLYVEKVPIYEGETAVLPMILLPEPDSAHGGEAERIVLGRPAVAGQGTRRQEGLDVAPYVLRQVVIPGVITVHLGSPDAYASNVQIPFSDYVKNVASSEIYPTWPDAALRANIYAIATFALNRIFTEWYRSRGYGFDITGSPAYDQAFVYGRAIYGSISAVVDEIFGEYVTRPGLRAPYFTSFCNGTTVTCQGLSQWGTVTLAQRGFTPLQILRSYYPDDVLIAEAEAVTNVLSSYPGTLLRRGSTGLNVQNIQNYLNRIRRNYPAIPAVTDTPGVFGGSTEAAVRQFQSIFDLVPDGIVGKATWYKISQVYTAVTGLAELDSEGVQDGVGTVPPDTVLRLGSGGSDVLTLQYLLSVIARFYPTVPSVRQDGVFGSSTRQAVIAFQRMRGLVADGIVGPATWRALYDVYLNIRGSLPDQGSPSCCFEYTVRAGDTLWRLSQRFGTTVDAIRRLNGLAGDLLNIGQVLLIPNG